MADKVFVAPNGMLIIGTKRKNGELIPVSDASATHALAIGKIIKWIADESEVAYADLAVFVDENGDEWLGHHLITWDEVSPLNALEKSLYDAMQGEVKWRRRGQMLHDLADTFTVDSENYSYWRSRGDEWIARSEAMRGNPAVVVNPSDPLRWPDGITTEFPSCKHLASVYQTKLHELKKQAVQLEVDFAGVTKFDNGAIRSGLDALATLVGNLITVLASDAKKGGDV